MPSDVFEIGSLLNDDNRMFDSASYIHPNPSRHFVARNYMIYLLTAIGLSPGGNSTVHIFTQTIHRTIQNKQYIEQHKHFGRVRAVPRLG